MAKKPLFTDEQPPSDYDRDALTAVEIAEIEKEAATEVEEERKATARKALKAKKVSELRRGSGLEEPTDQVVIDLAPYTDRLLIDNVAYLQGMTYTVPRSRAQVLREQMQRTWTHQAEIDGKSENFYRRTRGQRVVPSGGGAAVVSTGSLLRA